VAHLPWGIDADTMIWERIEFATQMGHGKEIEAETGEMATERSRAKSPLLSELAILSHLSYFSRFATAG